MMRALASPESEPQAGPLMRIAGITKRFGGLVALSDVSFDVAPGEIIGLIGPNGAGKTTLVNLITGVQRADEGTIEFEGFQSSGCLPIG